MKMKAKTTAKQHMGIASTHLIPAMAINKALEAVVVEEPQEAVRKMEANKAPANQAVHHLNPAMAI